MRKKVVLSAMIGALFFVAGCMDSQVIVNVKPDGSGTIEETLLMSNAVIQQMTMMMTQMQQQMGDAGGEAAPAPEAFDLFDEEKLKEKASEFGEGVAYVSGEKVETETHSGYKAVYSFADINAIKIQQDPGESMPQPAGTMANEEEKDDAISFQFTKGDPSSLVFKQKMKKEEAVPGAASSSEQEMTPEEEEEMAQQMQGPMGEMFKGMRMSLALAFEGDIVETNATYRDGNVITLMEMDFGKILEDPEKFKEFTKANPKSISEAKEIVKDVPGIKIDMNEELVVTFK